MGKYEVEIQGVKVKASVIDNAAILDNKIEELRSSLQWPVVGVDVKFRIAHHGCGPASLLILCGESCCLIIQPRYLNSKSVGLERFLVDENICFVGMDMYNKDRVFASYIRKFDCNSTLSNVVEVGDLSARVLQRPNIIKCGLEDLAREVGLNTATSTSVETETSLNWDAKIFSIGQIKCAIQEAYTCYGIGNKLFGMLDATS